jgi:hypothetical protein
MILGGKVQQLSNAGREACDESDWHDLASQMIVIASIQFVSGWRENPVGSRSRKSLKNRRAFIYCRDDSGNQYSARGDLMAMSKFNADVPTWHKVTDGLKSWIMLFLTLAFVLLYALALTGRLKPLPDVSLVSRLEPIIFVIIGYYFGRIPGQQNENSLKSEIIRQTQKADAAQHAKEQALQSREALEEKLKNVNAVLDVPRVEMALDADGNSPDGSNRTLHAIGHSVATARRVLKA